jgi:hypothetical protein
MGGLKQLLLEGKSHVESFFSPFLGKSVKIRALTAWELDDCVIKSLASLKSQKVVDLLVNVNLATIGMQDKVSLTPQEYAEFLEYNSRIDFYECYHSMKD